MDGVCTCGNYKCLAQIYWKGKYYEYRRDEQGYVFTYEKARDKLIDINKAIRSHTFNPRDFSDEQIRERRFENMMEKWLTQKAEEEQGNELAPTTLKGYRSNDRNYFGYFTGWDVREIGFEQLEAFKDQLPRTLSLKTRRNVLNTMHAFFGWLRKKGTIAVIPVWPEIRGDDARAMVALDIEDQEKALSRIPKEHRDAFIFMAETGARVNEMCALKIKDIDVKEGLWLVQRTYSGPKLVETTKARSKYPTVLSDTALGLVKRHAKGRFPDEFLFINPQTGRGYRYEFLSKLWRKHAGIDITLYEATRHSYCTQIAEMGINTLQARGLMRHADVRSTQKYFHVKIKKLRDVVNNRGRVTLIQSTKQK